MIRIVRVIIILLLFNNLESCAQVPQNSKKMKITYIMDPQCGWCYGNGDNIGKLKDQYQDKFEFELLVGGMWLGQNAPKGGGQLSQFLQVHAPRMATTTGTAVGSGYYVLARDSSYIFSSLEPSAAVVAVKQLQPHSVFEFAKKVQELLFLKGQRLDKLDYYIPILNELKISKNDFEKLWLSSNNLEKTKQEFKYASSKANGFPTLLLNDKILSSGYFELEFVAQKLHNL